MYAKLRACKSKYAELYRGPYPKKDNAMATSKKCMGEDIYADGSNCFRPKLTHEESKAIVNWVYRTLKNMKERETFTEELLRQIKEFNNISQSVCLTRGVVYNKRMSHADNCTHSSCGRPYRVTGIFTCFTDSSA